MNNKEKKYYTGVGSRETPLYIQYVMSLQANILEKLGFTLRSGRCYGPDAVFEDALESPEYTSEIYVPNKRFPYTVGSKFRDYYIIPKEINGDGTNSYYAQAMRFIFDLKLHKGWDFVPVRIRDLHNRNVFQVLGKQLSKYEKSKFIACYTKNKEKNYESTSKKTGGTGTAINVASKFDVPIFNLSVDEDFYRIIKFIIKHKKLINYDHINNMVPIMKFKKEDDFYNDKTYLELNDLIKNDLINRIQNCENFDLNIEDIIEILPENNIPKKKYKYK